MEQSTLNQHESPNTTFLNEAWHFAKHRANGIDEGFEIDKNTEKVMRALTLYFAEDERFESEGHGKLTKGIYLLGPVGVGKTLLMRVFSIGPDGTARYRMKATTKVVNDFIDHGFVDNYDPVCFDDLGVESIPAFYMGNKKNLMAEIISTRYESKGGIGFRRTHFTSNLDFGKAEALYGSRVRSRLKEMVNVLVLDGNDRRKCK